MQEGNIRLKIKFGLTAILQQLPTNTEGEQQAPRESAESTTTAPLLQVAKARGKGLKTLSAVWKA